MIHRDPLTVRLVRIGGLTLWLLITVFPLYWIFVSSLKAPADIAAYPVEYIPSRPTLENYVSLFSKSDFGQNMLSSLVVATVADSVAAVKAAATVADAVDSVETVKAAATVADAADSVETVKAAATVADAAAGGINPPRLSGSV